MNSAPPGRAFTTRLAYTGYWYCRSCQRVTDPQGEIQKRCGHAHCHSRNLKYCAPVPKPTLRQN